MICGRERPLVTLPNGQPAIYEGEDLATNIFAQFVIAQILGIGVNALDITDTSRAIAPASSVSSGYIVAGSGQLSATVADYGLNGWTSGSPYFAQGIASGGISGPSGSGASGTTTIIETITNNSGSTIQYDECGIYITVGGHQFCIAHDGPFSGGPFGVSGNGGTLQVTYTLTNS